MGLEIAFAGAMLLSAISGRTMMLAHRAGLQRPLNAANAALDLIGTVAGLAFWAIIVWGFSGLDWYVALPIILGASVIGGILPNPPRFEFFFRLERLIDFSVVALTVWLWVWHWPY